MSRWRDASQALRSNPLFAAIHMHTSMLWSSLLFKDGRNYSGYSSLPLSDSVDCSGKMDEAVDGGEIDSRWRLADDLDEMDGFVRDEFNSIVHAYLLKASMSTLVDETVRSSSPPLDPRILGQIE